MKVKPGFVVKEICGQNILVAEGEENIDFSNIISMNESSVYLWNKVAGMDSFTVADMVNFLQQEYDDSQGRAQKDCETLAAQWGKIGIIEGDDIPVIDVTINTVGSQQETGAPSEAPKTTEQPKKRGFLARLFHK